MPKRIREKAPKVLLLFSSIVFFCLCYSGSFTSAVSVAVAIAGIAVIVIRMPDDRIRLNIHDKKKFLLLLLSAIGIAIGTSDSFYYRMRFATPFICALVSSLSLYFLLVCLQLFWKRMGSIMNREALRMSRAEKLVYAIVFCFGVIYIAYTFSQSDAFYDAERHGIIYDVIYTSDSTGLNHPNSYLWLSHPENDLRQPLFALFAAPFMGIPYLLGRHFQFFVIAIFMEIAQFALLLAGNYLIAQAMKLKTGHRICFMILSSCTYTTLLFSLMMEQYIFAYFWLTVLIYEISTKGKADKMALCAAGGTLLTSLVFVPFATEIHPRNNFRNWLKESFSFGIWFVTLMLLFCRIDIILNLFAKVEALTTYTGKDIQFSGRLLQYVEFIKNCFLPPKTAIMSDIITERPVWHMLEVQNFSFIGLLIAVLAVFGFVFSRREKLSQIAAGWMIFSMIVLAVIGWGTQENGLILYSLYFGWAYFVLIFQLVLAIAGHYHADWLVPVFCIIGSVTLLSVNVPAICEMIRFAMEYYPV